MAVELTYKQRLFVSYYLGVSNGNATDAARRAGYGSPETLGRRLVRKGTIRAAIDARLDEVALTSDEILSRLSDIATGSLEQFIEVRDDGGYQLNLTKAKRKRRLHCLKKIKQGQFGVELVMHDPLNALDKLGKYRRLWSDGAESEIGQKTEEELNRALNDDDGNGNDAEPK